MEVVGSVASVIAIVQAAGMLKVVATSFWDVFISKENDDRGGEANERAASIEEFIQKIKVLEFTAAAMTSPAATVNAVDASGLGATLQKCLEQLEPLRKKVKKMSLPPNANQWKRWKTRVRMKLNETELDHLETTIGTMLTQIHVVISFAQIELARNSDARSQQAQHEAAQILRSLEQGQKDDRAHVFDHQTALLKGMQDKLDENGIRLQEQQQLFQDGNDMLLKALAKLTISPRIERIGSELSGTTEGSIVESMENEEVIVPIAPGLIHHPGFQFRDDRLDKADISRGLLNVIERWLNPSNVDAARLYINTARTDDATQDLCNRVVYELANSMLLCYNGLPREGSPPADGWYTMAHLVWWLSAQLRMAMPHIDGHMPASGYSPDVASLAAKLEKTQDNDPVYVVLYLPTESCHDESDRELYSSLVEGLCKIPSSSGVRILLFSDGSDGEVQGYFGTNIFDVNNLTNQDFVPLTDWEFPEFV